MFLLSEFKDTIRIVPADFAKPKAQALADEINKKYANKVSIEEAGDGIVQHSEGSAYYKVRFNMVVFRPFIGEVFVGVVKACSEEEGVQVSLGFFDDIFIPPALLPTPDKKENLWAWKFNEELGEQGTLYMDLEERIRIRINSEKFVDTGVTDSKRAQVSTFNSKDRADAPPEEPALSPYSLVADVTEQGSGLLSWWT
ncbi:DNA-directed RNA polymerase III complex subunit Rpc25 [Sorochytrium milnesiophthora]